MGNRETSEHENSLLESMRHKICKYLGLAEILSLLKMNPVQQPTSRFESAPGKYFIHAGATGISSPGGRFFICFILIQKLESFFSERKRPRNGKAHEEWETSGHRVI